MKNNLLLFAFVVLCTHALAQQHLYLIPGQGSDERIFKNWNIDPNKWQVHYIKHQVPPRGCDMAGYARILAQQIDTSEPFSIAGVSLGGMVATEMAAFLHPETVVVISSAKNRQEIPLRYRWMKKLPFWRAVPPVWYKYGSLLAQPLVEPDRINENATCNAMLLDKDPVFLKRATGMIANWDRREYGKNIYHLHGSTDHTLPVDGVKANYVLNKGSHMMALTRGPEVWAMVEQILLKKGMTYTVSQF